MTQNNMASNGLNRNQTEVRADTSNELIRRQNISNEGSARNYFGMLPTVENIRFIQQNKILFISGKSEVVDPYQESYLTMLKTNFFPHLQWLSITAFIIVACTVLFIVAVSMGFYNNSFLEVGSGTYTMLGVNNAALVYRGQVYRLVVSLFIHINLMHLFSNMLVLLLILSSLQYSFGCWKTLAVYLGSGIAGGIFSDLVAVDQSNSMIKAGASTALYGMVGISLGYMIINWPSLEFIGNMFKFKIIVFLFLLLVFLILFTDVATNVDYAGHVGGLMGGFFLSGVLPSLKMETREIVLRIVFSGLYLVMVVSGFLFFYLMPQPGYSS